MRLRLSIGCLVLVTFSSHDARSAEPGPNRADEPMAESYSLKAARGFLDQASLDWTQKRKCFTCHTNYAHLMARPAYTEDTQAHRDVRAALEDMVETRWEKNGPRWHAEVVMTAAVLALNDAATTKKLHPTTRKALDRMWTVQRKDGGVTWLKCDWPPMEDDDDFGASMIAIAVGAAPEEYRQSEAAKAGLAKVRDYFSKHPAPTLHHWAMMLWADSYLGDLLTKEERKTTIRKLRELQNDDGGWAVASLGDWKRGDGKEQSSDSDGYGTGFVIYVLRRAGVAADDAQLQKGVAWLKSNQRASGRWYTRSLYMDNSHYLSHAGSAFATLAITSCEK